jgi:hypothetical protein
MFYLVIIGNVKSLNYGRSMVDVQWTQKPGFAWSILNNSFVSWFFLHGLKLKFKSNYHDTKDGLDMKNNQDLNH